jgi:predicted DNA binding CopG/RHH family protein
MQDKRTQRIPAVNPRASYVARARYYERHSTQELVDAGQLIEVGIRAYPQQTETLSVRVDKMLLAQLKRMARKKKLPLRTLIRRWLVQHAQEEIAA